jgi:predicted MPP superfamily phosphohydrolase
MRKKIVWGALTIAVAIGLIHVAHMLTLDRIVQYKEMTFYSENWPQALDGYRIGFMADTHRLDADELAAIVAALNARELDLLLLGGDYGFRRHYLESTLKAFGQVETTDGVFGVQGNHDIYFPLEEIMYAAGIGFLGNDGLQVRDGFFLSGVRDLWWATPCIATATAAAAEGDFVLLLTHNPDVSMQQDTLGVDLILAGHTHGGQITFFGWPFYLYRGSITSYGTRFGYGWARSGDDTPVYATRGIGRYSVPRVFARPQAVIFTMRSK